MAVVQISDKGQITLPARIRKKLGIKPRSQVVVTVRDGEVLLRPLRSIRDLAGSLAEYAIPGMTWEKERETAMRAVADHVSREGLEPEYWPENRRKQMAQEAADD